MFSYKIPYTIIGLNRLICLNTPSSITLVIMGKCGFSLPSEYKYRRVEENEKNWEKIICSDEQLIEIKVKKCTILRYNTVP